MTETEARERCRKEGTAQCAAICLQYFASTTCDGRCPHAVEVWNLWEVQQRKKRKKRKHPNKVRQLVT